jgi:hypothetical protein|tara:strand:+ start:455 stop:850 length:396 start_codon:yes stop_codon:yes gene_type:complete
MTSINIITAPDVLHNKALSFLLIQPRVEIRNQFQNLLKHFDEPINVYLYDPVTDEERDYSWLLAISKMSDFTIVDVDNLSTIERNLTSYLISLPNTFYLTTDNYTPYNMLSVNRIYNLDWLYEKLKRGTHE